LMARIKVILKRKDNDKDVICVGGISIDNIAHEVSVDGNPIELTPKEYELLKYLVNNKNIALSRENLLSNIWGYDFYGDDRTVDTHIKTLRSHLGKYRNLIKTVREVGYKLEYKE
jgi:two-component system response regulator ResD